MSAQVSYAMARPSSQCRCALKPGNEWFAVDDSTEILGDAEMLAYAKAHSMLLMCDDCFSVIADFRNGGAR